MPVKFGPGSLTIGNASTEFDASCLVNSCTISSDTDQGDSTTKLCGTVVPGATTFTYTLSGNVDIDSNDAAGLFALSQAAKGQQLPFEFTPHNGGTQASGVLVITPLDFGGDDFGTDMTSDFEWTIVGEPAYAFYAGSSPVTQAADWWEPFVLTTPQVPAPVGPAPLTGAGTPATSGDTPATSASDSGSESASESVSESEMAGV